VHQNGMPLQSVTTLAADVAPAAVSAAPLAGEAGQLVVTVGSRAYIGYAQASFHLLRGWVASKVGFAFRRLNLLKPPCLRLDPSLGLSSQWAELLPD
jgi:hypothetical protein